MFDEKTKKRIKFIVLILYIVTALAVIYFVITKALAIVMPFIIAFAVAMLLQRPSYFIEKKTHEKVKKKWAAIFLLILLLVLIVAIISFAGVAIVSYIREFIDYLRGFISTKNISELKDTLINYTSTLNGGLRTVAQKAINALYDYASNSEKLTSLATGVAGSAWDMAKNVPSFLLASLIAVIACFFANASWDRVKDFFMAQLGPKHQELARSTKVAFRDSIGHLLTAYIKIIGVTFAEVLVGFYILKVVGVYTGGFIPLIALIIAIVDILPVLGTGTIMVPWMIYNVIMSNYWFAAGQLALYLIICIVRQYIEPKFVGKSIGLNPLVTLMAMYIGLKVFGAIGMFLLPVAIIVLKALQDTGKIRLWASIPKDEDEVDTSVFEKIKARLAKKKQEKGEE